MFGRPSSLRAAGMKTVWAAKRFGNKSSGISSGNLVALAAAIVRTRRIMRNTASLVSGSCETRVTPCGLIRASRCMACLLHQKRHQLVGATWMRNGCDLGTRILNKREIGPICREKVLVSRQAYVPPLPSILASPNSVLVPYTQPFTKRYPEQSNRSRNCDACDIHRCISFQDPERVRPIFLRSF